ncbi:putative non-specific protein-tyrosine kinase [Rosa chinensis]|uniref:Putative non-specific protein-tyrosine kinase n=1 Tax=Rosa chinensis TaxID=74649 RepID=A0A2P6Q386_ROSCH|nr:putative non-specific protein-tyrosine kinase [Rosa chinensis]
MNSFRHIWQLWNEGRGLELVDEELADSYSSSDVMRCVHIGLLCVQDNAADRPTMPDIVLMLGTDTDIPQPTQPPPYRDWRTISDWKLLHHNHPINCKDRP